MPASKVISPVHKVAMPMAKGLVFFCVSDLLYFEADGKECVAYFLEKDVVKKCTVFKGIASLEPKLRDLGFLLIRRNILINAIHIHSVAKDMTITMIDGKVVHTSQRKLRQVESYIEEHFCV